MTLKQLEYFKVLAEVQHYTKAAEKLLISQPSLSYSISELEKELNIPLFEKRGKKIILNNYGKLFLSYVNQALDKLDEGIKQLNILIDPGHGTINLGYIYSVGSSLLANMIEKFYENPLNKEINFNFIQNATQNIMKDLLEGKVDLAISGVETKTESISSVPLLDQELFLIVHKNHRLSDEREVELNEIAKDSLILLNKNTGIRLLLDKIFERNDIKPNIVFEAEECNAVTAFVSSKLGISILPMVPSIDESKVSIIKIKTPECRRTLYLSWVEDRFMPPPVEKFKELVIGEYSLNNDRLELL
jgi:DNA-binding transcriptional LysR family regulator